MATHDVLPFTFVFLAVAAAGGDLRLPGPLVERALAGGRGGRSCGAAGHLAGHQRRGLPEGYAAIPHGWLLGAQVALLAIYLASTIVRTLFRGFTFTGFETAQCAAAFLSAWAAACGSPAEPTTIVAAFAAGLRRRLLPGFLRGAGRGAGRGRNFYTYSTFGILLVLAGSRILLAGVQRR